jgi:hypothetical protein
MRILAVRFKHFASHLGALLAKSWMWRDVTCSGARAGAEETQGDDRQVRYMVQNDSPGPPWRKH